MSEDELILVMRENGFSKKQIETLQKLSKKYSSSLHETVVELARRFPRSLFAHVLIFLLIAYAYFRDSGQGYYTSWHLLSYVGDLCVMYFILDFFAPLFRGYKARKVIKEIKMKERSK